MKIGGTAERKRDQKIHDQQERERQIKEWMATKDHSGRVLLFSVGAGMVRCRPGTPLIACYSDTWAHAQAENKPEAAQ